MADLGEQAAPWLFGADASGAGVDHGAAKPLRGVVGLLARLTGAFTGDPAGPSQTLNVGGGPAGLTVPDQANAAIVTIEAVSVRLQTDGTEATTTAGLLLPVGTILTLTGRATLKAARFVGTAAGAIVQAAYYT